MIDKDNIVGMSLVGQDLKLLQAFIAYNTAQNCRASLCSCPALMR